MHTRSFLATNLASALLGGAWSLAALQRRVLAVTGRRAGVRALVRRVYLAFPETPGPRAIDALTAWIMADHGFAHDIPVKRSALLPRVMAPSPWPVPSIATESQLAGWFGITVGELEWFADRQGRNASQRPGPLRHYIYRTIPKRGGRERLIESPKKRLKDIQRQILGNILDFIPPHDAAHGFRRRRNIATFATPHVGRRLVMRLDLADFFTSVRASRVHAIFRKAGYPKAVTRLLTGLCTNVTPDDALPVSLGYDVRRLARERHLPQGAPTSPALANLCAWRFDTRLARLAEKIGATYTRYADDLAFSGDDQFAKQARRIFRVVCRIAVEEGFRIRAAKTRFMPRAARQRLAGVIVNACLNIPRGDFDLLKAILTNSARHGPASQNCDGHADFRAHLLGRIAFVAMLHPNRGDKLRALFERVAWHGS